MGTEGDSDGPSMDPGLVHLFGFRELLSLDDRFAKQTEAALARCAALLDGWTEVEGRAIRVCNYNQPICIRLVVQVLYHCGQQLQD